MFKTEQLLQERYQLQKPLGRTAVGHQTWLAVDLHSDEKVAVKLLAFSPQMQWEELKLFEREAQVLQALNHPRIPRYRDYFELDKQVGGGVPWFALVQDYISGFSFQELLEQGQRFSEQQVRLMAIEVLEILIYLHELSPPVLHRDIKPSNLILGEDRHIYLVDFGAVQAKAAVTGVTFTVVGTSGYAPLEQFWGRAVPASDLYALGATLIHLLTGKAPVDLPQKDSRVQFANYVSLKPDFVGWIEKATEIALEKRFRMAREALEALKSGNFRPTSTTKLPVYKPLLKPDNTRIQIDRSTESLKIHIPAKGLRRSIISVRDIISFLLAIIIMLAFTGLLFPLFLLLIFLYQFARSTDIYFGNQKFGIQDKILGLTYRNLECPNYQIKGIFLHSSHRNYKIRIRTWTDAYFLGDALSEDECAWLAQEIQDWLNDR